MLDAFFFARKIAEPRDTHKNITSRGCEGKTFFALLERT
jgi:hypothetical protein